MFQDGYIPSKDSKRKIVVVGDAYVGKSSIIGRFAYNSNPGKHKNTVGVC